MPIRITRVYTRRGDRGETDLVGGERIRKDSPRIEAYGTVDELNAAVGVARAANEAELATDDAHAAARRELDDILRRLQNQLFDLGGELATPPAAAAPESFRMSGAEVKGLEATIDHCLKDLAPLKSFILPGGSSAAAYLHLARTMCRRAERIMVALNDKPGETVTAAALKYVNRLSDFLFVAARSMNHKGATDVLWVPGQNR